MDIMCLDFKRRLISLLTNVGVVSYYPWSWAVRFVNGYRSGCAVGSGALSSHTAVSKEIGLTRGVPQESVLGPAVLFLACIKVIDYAVDAIIKKFSDDTKLCSRVRRELALSMQNSLNDVLKWGNE